MTYRLGKLQGKFCVVWNENGRRHRHRLHTVDAREAKALLEQFKAPVHIPHAEDVGFIYFIECLEGCRPIKIGFARDPARRLNGIQVSCPFPLALLGVIAGNRALETRLQDQFKAHRIVGEWFKPVDCITEYISQNSAPIPKPKALDAVAAVNGVLDHFAQLSKVQPNLTP